MLLISPANLPSVGKSNDKQEEEEEASVLVKSFSVPAFPMLQQHDDVGLVGGGGDR